MNFYFNIVFMICRKIFILFTAEDGRNDIIVYWHSNIYKLSILLVLLTRLILLVDQRASRSEIEGGRHLVHVTTGLLRNTCTVSTTSKSPFASSYRGSMVKALVCCMKDPGSNLGGNKPFFVFSYQNIFQYVNIYY